MTKNVDRLVDHLFRHKAGEMIAILTRHVGARHLGLVEDVVQEALTRALRDWPFKGVPADPSAWLFRVARNAALDAVRRHATRTRYEADVVDLLESRLASEDARSFATEIADDQLRLIFIACHPAISPAARVALTLRTVGGFGVGEIARAFLVPEPTIAQRLVRAKRLIADQELPYAVPGPDELAERLSSVIDVLYSMFNEGYGASSGDDLVRFDLCAEAVRLAEIVAAHPVTGNPETFALAALMRFQGARLPARQNEAGDLLLLPDQDRDQWDQTWIARGVEHLAQAGEGERLTRLHLEAGIAACHAVAPDYAGTDWAMIVQHYAALVARDDSPVLVLNQAVAVAEVDGPAAGLAIARQVAEAPALKGYYFLPATLGELYRRLGDREAAAAAFGLALSLARAEPVRRFLQGRLDEVAGVVA